MYALDKFDANIFNSLPNVDWADQALRASDKLARAVDHLGPLFVEAGLNDDWGISLLHNHWPVFPGELPLQELELGTAGDVLITSPRAASNEGSCWPTAIAITPDGAFKPVELSTLPDAQSGYSTLVEQAGFLAEVARVWVREGLCSTFALTRLRYDASGRDVYLEKTLPGRVSQVRRVRADLASDSPYIETTWRFSPHETTLGCQQICVQVCDDDGASHSNQHRGPMHRPT